MRDNTAYIVAMGMFLLFLIALVILNPQMRDREIYNATPADSLTYYSEQEKIHADSATYYQIRYENELEKYTAAWAADSTKWDSLRTIYNRAIREAIHRELTR